VRPSRALISTGRIAASGNPSSSGRETKSLVSCLVLRSQGLKYREIAEALNLSVSTVGENVQRGLEKLKELL